MCQQLLDPATSPTLWIQPVSAHAGRASDCLRMMRSQRNPRWCFADSRPVPKSDPRSGKHHEEQTLPPKGAHAPQISNIAIRTHLALQRQTCGVQRAVHAQHCRAHHWDVQDFLGQPQQWVCRREAGETRGAYLCHKLPVDSDAGTAVIVEAIPIAALLVGVQVHAPALGGGSAHQVQPLVQLAQLQGAECKTCVVRQKVPATTNLQRI